MNYYQLLGRVGPWATPAPAAIALAGRLYGEWAGVNMLSAVSMSLFSLIALETVGGLCSYQAIQTSLDRRWAWFIVNLAGVLAYMCLGVWALWGVSAWIFVVLAVFTHIAVAADLVTGQQAASTVSDREFELEKGRIELRTTNAQVRKAIAEAQAALTLQVPVQMQQDLLETSASSEHPSIRVSKYEQACQILLETPSISERKLAKALGCADSTAHSYKERFKNEREQHLGKSND